MDSDAPVVRIDPRAGWPEIPLPPRTLHGLKSLARAARRHSLAGRPAFARRKFRGRAVLSLFAGGNDGVRVLAAEAVAHDLGLDLYRIDLAGVASKYIGEVEKNLKRVLDAAEASGGVLLFDEADALFGKRCKVADTHGRLSRMAATYFFRRLESHSGLVVLAMCASARRTPAVLRHSTTSLTSRRESRCAGSFATCLTSPELIPI